MQPVSFVRGMVDANDLRGEVMRFWLLARQSARAIAFVGTCLAMVAPASAQDMLGRNVPVIAPKPDLNGVDVASGSLNVESPFKFEAPGAGHLSSTLLFNGRKLTTTLNVYLDDQTLVPWGQGSVGRQIRVHLGGIDRLFDCPTIGQCAQVSKVDGSILNRTATNSYSFRDREGTAVAFFPMQFQPLYNNCVDIESGCNAAEYQGYAYAASVTYANGEKLTFADFPQVSGSNYVLTVSSNLGYTLDVATPCIECSVTTAYPGAYWLVFRLQPSSATYTLRRNGQEVSRFSVSQVTLYGGGTSGAKAGDLAGEKDVTISDRIGRNFYIKLQSKYVATCGTPILPDGSVPPNWNTATSMGALDGSTLAPVRLISPGGIQTDITYKNILQFGPSMNYVPVESVTRGGQTWHYAFAMATTVLGANAALTSTDPGGNSQTAWSASNENPWPTSWGYNETNWCNGNTIGSDVVKTTDANSLSKSFTYAWPGVVASATMPEGDNQVYTYDGRGNLAQITATPKTAIGGAAVILFQADFDAVCANPVKCNQPNWTRDARGAQTDYLYDPVHGQATQITLPPDASGVRPQKRMSYEAFSTSSGPLYRLQQISECATLASCTGGADEIKRSFTYWDSTLLKATESVQQGSGAILTTHYVYDYAGRLAQATSPGGGSTWFIYDAVGRKVGTIGADPDGAGGLPQIAQRVTYDSDDRVVRVEEGTVVGSDATALAALSVNRTTDTLYDAQGRKIRDTVSASGVVYQLTQYSYDPAGRLECTAVRMNPAAFGGLPVSACILGSEGAQGPDRITRNVYDPAGRLVQVRKAVGTAIEQAYVTYGYTPNGKQEYVVDANGNKARLLYDGLDRQVQWQFPAVSAPGGYNPSTPANALATAGAVNTADYEAYGYDANNNRISLRKRDGRTIGYTYDLLNRMTSKAYPNGGARPVFYSYDLRGLQKAARFDSASGVDAVLSDWDGFGRQTSSTTNMAGTSRQFGYQYDADGNRTRVTHPDGHFVNYYRDGLDRLYYADLDGSAPLFYPPYDPLGRVSTLYRWGHSAWNWAFGTNYGYDAVSRLTSYGHSFSSGGNVATGLAHNPADQIVSRTRDNGDFAFAGYENVNRPYAANGLNQYTSAGSAVFGYDPNGNLTSDGATGYTYDIENRLVGSTAGTQLTYDPLGRLWQTYSPSTGTTQFLYDGDALTAEYNGAGNMLKRYVHGAADGEDDPLVEYIGSSLSPRYLFADHQGSVIALADANGNRIAVNSYDEYGIPRNTVTGNREPYGRFAYTGQAWIPELGMYHYKARIYSPTLGRFMQTDPIGYEDQVNLYAYVANDPLNRSDPTGLGECPPDCSFLQRTGQFLLGAAEVVTGVVAIGAGAAGDGVSVAGTVATGGAAAPITVPAAIGSTALITTGVVVGADGIRRMAGAVFNTDPNAQDKSRVEAQRDRRAVRRENRSRGPNGNGQNRSGEGFRDREQANRGPKGERPKGPDRRNNRERNRGIDEEHSIKPKGQQRY